MSFRGCVFPGMCYSIIRRSARELALGETAMWTFNIKKTEDTPTVAIACWSEQHAKDVRAEMFSAGKLDNVQNFWIEDPEGDVVGYMANE